MYTKDTILFQNLLDRWEEMISLPLEGCTDSDIVEIMNQQQVTYLPDIYQKFLLRLGRQSGGIENIYGDEFRYPYLLEFKKDVFPYMLEDPTPDIFIFWNYENENVHFFRTDQKEVNPMILNIRNAFKKNKSNEIIEYKYLSRFLIDVIEGAIEGIGKR